MVLFELQNVTKAFGTMKTKTLVLNGINVSFPSRGLWVIYGPSGSGKSTLLNLLCGLDTPTSGTILFNGIPLEKQSPKQRSEIRRSQMGRVFQHYELLDDLDALTNVVMPLYLNGESMALAHRRGEELLKMYGLEACSKKTVGLLSGGEKQRLALIRSIIHHPRVLFADEPTGALDHGNAQIVAEMLHDYSQKALVIVVTHDHQLFKDYATGVLAFKGQTLEVEKKADSIPKTTDSPYFEKKRNGRIFWPSILAKKHFVQRKNIHAVSLLAAGIAWASCLLTVGFAYGAGPSIVDASKRFFDLGTASISKVSKMPIEGSPLALMQSSRPSISEMAQFSEHFETMRFGVDLGPLFESVQGRFATKDMSGFSFCPIRNFSLSSFQQKLLVEGHFPLEDSFDTVIINREMLQKIGNVFSWDEPLLLSGQGLFDLSDPGNPLTSVKETFSFSLKMRIAAVVEETSFLNEPRIFYSYQAASVFLSQTEATLYSGLVGKSTSWLQILQDASSNEMLSSYHYLVFLQDEKGLERLYVLSQKENVGSLRYEITSHAFSHREALTSIAFVLRIALIFFVVISLIGSTFVLGISGYSSFISKLKESAILLSMGATYQEICSIFRSESMFIGLFSSVFGIFLSLPAQALVNRFFENNLGIGHPIAIPLIDFWGFPFSLVFLVLLMSVGLSLLATGFPIALFHQSNLVACLRDE